MVEVRQALCRYLKQQSELGMPDVIFSPGGLQKMGANSVAAALSPVETPRAFMPATGAPAQQAPVPARKPASPRPLENLRVVTAWEVPAGELDFEGKREALKEVFVQVRSCHLCPLGASRTNTVFGAGNVNAPLLAIGEAPGAEEDTQGLPFVGRAGVLLTEMFKAIGLDRKKDVFITNVLKCRPPKNRNPESAEILACNPVLKKQIEIIRPRAILLMGRIAAHTILDRSDSISRMRAESYKYLGIPTVVTYHPAALLRYPQYKRPTWEDLQKLQKILNERSGHAGTVS